MGARISKLALALALAIGCAASTRPAVSPEALRSVGPPLGARVTAEGCPLGTADLVARTAALWRTDPFRDTFGPEWKCVALDDDLARDSMGACAPPPADVFERPLPFARRVSGELFYVGLDPREYAYDLVPREGGVEVQVRVRLLGAYADDPAHVAAMQAKMDRAAELWTRFAPDGRARFRFRAVKGDDEWPHFEVTLAPGDARTPFDVTWGAEWSWHLLAHEIGHMMGLDDEYGQVKKTVGHAVGADGVWDRDPAAKVEWFGCDPHSLMCDSKGEQSTPQRYHYYLVLRRRYCKPSRPERPPL